MNSLVKKLLKHSSVAVIFELNGTYHRENGPAVERDSGYKQWWLKGVCYSEEEYWEVLNEF